MGAFEDFIPRLAPGAQTLARGDGSAVVLLHARALEIAADQAQLLALMDGRRTLAEVSAEHYQQHKFVPFQAMVDLLSTLRTQDLLQGTPFELDQAGIASFRSTSPGRGILVAHIPIPRVVSVALGVSAALAVVAWLGACLLGKLAFPDGVHPGALGPGGSPLYGLLLGLGGVSAALTLRSFLRSGLAAAWGAPIAHVDLRIRGPAPALELEGAPIPVLGRGKRIACYALALVGPWIVAFAAGSLLPAEWVPPATLGALVTGFIDLCPFAPTSLGHLLAVIAGRVDLRDHARSYLSRRLLARRGARRVFVGERVILATSTLSVVWCSAAVYFAATGVPHTVVHLLESGLQLGPLEALATGLYVILLVGGSAVALFLLIRLVLTALASAAPAALRERGPTSRAPVTAIPSELRKVRLLAGLPDAVLEALGKEVHQASFKAQSAIVAQGATVERLYGILEGTVAVLREEESGLERRVSLLGPGDCFGETALFSSTAAPATYRAEEAVLALEFTRESFQKLSTQLPGQDLSRLMRAAATLHRSPLLSRMAPERIASLLPKLVPVNLEKGKNAVTRGEPGDFFYVVDHGELEVLDAHEKPIATLVDGDHFGEIALLRNVPRTATVRTTVPTSLWSLSKADFFGVLSHDLALSQAVEGQASARVRGK